MSRTSLTLALSVLALFLVTVGSAAASEAVPSAAAPSAVRGATPAPKADDPEREAPIYGPVRARDLATRIAIKQLYREIRALEEETNLELTTLTAELRAEQDPDFRRELQQRAARAKQDLLRDRMSLSLEIARLNGEDDRVAEYERALDQLLNPEKYRPAFLDPAVQAERVREKRTKGGETR